jgi:hypothetical protein
MVNIRISATPESETMRFRPFFLKTKKANTEMSIMARIGKRI